jgi:hypothetical protein
MKNFFINTLEAPDGSLSATRLGFFIVLGLLTVVIARWFVTGQDVPCEIARLVEVAIGAVCTTKFVQRFAEKTP